MLFIIACLILGWCAWKLVSSPLQSLSFIIKGILLFVLGCGIFLCMFAFLLYA